MRRIWKEYFENLYNIDTEEQVAVHMCYFDVVRRDDYSGEYSNGRTEVEVRLGKLKNKKAAGKDEITGEMMKGGGDRILDYIWRLCNKAYENGVVTKDWRSVVFVPLNKVKRERRINVRVVGKIYAGILLDRVPRVNVGLNDNEQGGFRAGSGCVDQIMSPWLFNVYMDGVIKEVKMGM